MQRMIHTVCGVIIWASTFAVMPQPASAADDEVEIKWGQEAENTKAIQNTEETLTAVEMLSERLMEAAIEPTVDSVKVYIKDTSPTPASVEHVDSLIRQLGGAKFKDREAAEKTLVTMGLLAEGSVKKALISQDPEVRMRAAQLITSFNNLDSRQTLTNALRFLQGKKAKNCVALILGIVPLCNNRYMRVTTTRVLVALAVEDDKTVLRAGLKHKNVHVRTSALFTLSSLVGPDGADEIRPWLKDDNAEMRLAAGHALADIGDRASLPVLIDLLASTDKAIRIRSSAILRGLTGKYFNFAAYGAPQERRQAIAKWKQWLEKDGESAMLKFPLPRFFDGSHLHGHTLIALTSKGEVIEIDQLGKTVWSYKLLSVYSAEKMASGNILMASYSLKKVIEVDMQGKEVWAYPNCQALNAKPLPNGNILIAEYQNKRVLEVSKRENKVVWEYIRILIAATRSGCRTGIHSSPATDSFAK